MFLPPPPPHSPFICPHIKCGCVLSLQLIHPAGVMGRLRGRGRPTPQHSLWSWRRSSTSTATSVGPGGSRWLHYSVWRSDRSRSGSRTAGWSTKRTRNRKQLWTQSASLRTFRPPTAKPHWPIRSTHHKGTGPLQVLSATMGWVQGIIWIRLVQKVLLPLIRVQIIRSRGLSSNTCRPPGQGGQGTSKGLWGTGGRRLHSGTNSRPFTRRRPRHQRAPLPPCSPRPSARARPSCPTVSHPWIRGGVGAARLPWDRPAPHWSVRVTLLSGTAKLTRSAWASPARVWLYPSVSSPAWRPCPPLWR